MQGDLLPGLCSRVIALIAVKRAADARKLRTDLVMPTGLQVNVDER